MAAAIQRRESIVDSIVAIAEIVTLIVIIGTAFRPDHRPQRVGAVIEQSVPAIRGFTLPA